MSINDGFIIRHDGARGDRRLTHKEKIIVELICLDCSTKEIADAVGRSPKTIDHHRGNIYRKTQTNSLIGLFRWAILNMGTTVTNEPRAETIKTLTYSTTERNPYTRGRRLRKQTNCR